MTDLPPRCCGRCKHFDRVGRRSKAEGYPGYCHFDFDNLLPTAIVIHNMESFTAEVRGTDCPCFEPKEPQCQSKE